MIDLALAIVTVMTRAIAVHSAGDEVWRLERFECIPEGHLAQLRASRAALPRADRQILGREAV
jgi:hypothetical protein